VNVSYQPLNEFLSQVQKQQEETTMMPGSIPNISRHNHRQTLRTDEKNPNTWKKKARS
jgi:hypothetical protein